MNFMQQNEPFVHFFLIIKNGMYNKMGGGSVMYVVCAIFAFSIILKKAFFIICLKNEKTVIER